MGSFLPASMALLLFRLLQLARAIWLGQCDRIVASHEVEDEIKEASSTPKEQG